MFRPIFCGGLLVLGLMVALAAWLPATRSGPLPGTKSPAPRTGAGQDNGGDQRAQAKPKGTGQAVKQLASEARLILDKLKRTRSLVDKPITADFPPGATIKDAVEYLQDRYGASILIDEQAWKDDPDLKDQFKDGILNQPVHLPKLVGARFATVLRLLFRPVGGDFQVRADLIMVLPRKQVTSGEILRQPVDATFDSVPLEEALEHLAALTGVSIVLDSRVGDDAGAPVKAAFAGLPLEAAVRMLADMAGLKPVRLDNGLYVTTKDNAKVLQGEEEKRKRAMPRTEAAGAAAAKTGKAAAGKGAKP